MRVVGQAPPFALRSRSIDVHPMRHSSVGNGRATGPIQPIRPAASVILARDTDPENVVSTTFLTADVGKLYLMLREILGKK